MSDLKGRVALVTGGGREVGAAGDPHAAATPNPNMRGINVLLVILRKAGKTTAGCQQDLAPRST